MSKKIQENLVPPLGFQGPEQLLDLWAAPELPEGRPSPLALAAWPSYTKASEAGERRHFTELPEGTHIPVGKEGERGSLG